MTEQTGARTNVELSIMRKAQNQASREFSDIWRIHPLNHSQQIAVHSLITNLICAEAFNSNPSSMGAPRNQYWDRALTSLKSATGAGVPEQVVRSVFLARESLRPAVEAMS